MEKSNFTNFVNSYKIHQNSQNDSFYAVVIRRKKKFILPEKIGVSGVLESFHFLQDGHFGGIS